MPLIWLLVSSTKSLDDLFDSFGLWFRGFNLTQNISDTFSKDDGSWRFAERRLYVDWTETRTLHAPPPPAGSGEAPSDA